MNLLVILKDEIHPDILSPSLNNIVFRFGTTLPPNHPGNRFEEGRFPRSIGAADTSGMQTPKVEGGLAVAEEVFEC
jgi:hypothetical protein